MDQLYLASLKQQISEEFPDFKIVAKADSTLMKAIDVFLRVVTLGQMRLFMTSFVTTLGTTVYVPTRWDTYSPFNQAVILRHERVHMRQARRMTRPLFSLVYLFAFFPLFLAWGRAKLEKEAYEESLRAYFEFGADLKNPVLKETMVQHFVSAEYGWMWPFKKSIEAWYDETSKKIESL